MTFESHITPARLASRHIYAEARARRLLRDGPTRIHLPSHAVLDAKCVLTMGITNSMIMNCSLSVFAVKSNAGRPSWDVAKGRIAVVPVREVDTWSALARKRPHELELD